MELSCSRQDLHCCVWDLSCSIQGPVPCCCSSVAQSCLTLCSSMDCSTPGLPPGVCPSSCPLHQWYHSAVSSSSAVFSLCPQSFSASGTFPLSQLFASDDQNSGVSALASVLPMSIQGWFPLRLAGLISLLSKGLSEVFSNTTVWRHQFFSARAVEDKVLQIKLTYFS